MLLSRERKTGGELTEIWRLLLLLVPLVLMIWETLTNAQNLIETLHQQRRRKEVRFCRKVDDLLLLNLTGSKYLVRVNSLLNSGLDNCLLCAETCRAEVAQMIYA